MTANTPHTGLAPSGRDNTPLMRHGRSSSSSAVRAGLPDQCPAWPPAASDERAGARSDAIAGGERSIAPISSLPSSKSKTSKFSTIRSGVTDFGNSTSPSCRCQRMTTCPGVLRCELTISPTVGSSSTSPCASDSTPR